MRSEQTAGVIPGKRGVLSVRENDKFYRLLLFATLLGEKKFGKCAEGQHKSAKHHRGDVKVEGNPNQSE